MAPPLVLDTAAAAEQRPQQVGTRALLRAAPRHPCLPGVPPRGWCRLATVATPACWAGAVLGASQLGSPASLGRHGWLCMAPGDAPHSRGAALPCRAEAGAHTQTPRRKVRILSLPTYRWPVEPASCDAVIAINLRRSMGQNAHGCSLETYGCSLETYGCSLETYERLLSSPGRRAALWSLPKVADFTAA